MELKINAYMQRDVTGGFIAWINDSKKLNMVVHGDTPEKATSELITSLKVALMHSLDIQIDEIKQLTEEQYLSELAKTLQETGRRELKFQAA